MVRILLSTRLGERRLTQADLARMTGIRPNTISELYNEVATRISLDHIDLICEALYYNVIMKNGKIQYALKAIGETVILGRDRQKRKYRAFAQEAQAERYLQRYGFTSAIY